MHASRVLLAVAAVLTLSACSGSKPAPEPTLTAPVGAGTSTGATSTPANPTPTATTPAARNLPVTDAVRQQLLARAAASVNLPVSDFVGLAHGDTYFALDTSTGTYWAAAALIPSPSSTPAQVAVQDDGAYLLFDLHGGDPAHGAWQVHDVGTAAPTGSGCAVHPPLAITSLWGWDKDSCRPELLAP